MKKNYDAVIIGHISLDYNIDYQDKTIVEVGGAVIYSSAAAYALGHSVLAITKLAESDKNRLDAFTIPESDILYIPTSGSTSIRNKYHTADKERRTSTCIHQAEGFSIEDIPAEVTSEVYHLAGLIYGDFESNLIPELSKRGKVAVDVQALLRHRDPESGLMYFEDWKEKRENLPYIDYLKLDAAEAEIMTGLTDRAEAAKLLHSWGAKEVVITHNTEVIAFDGERIYAAPIKARNLTGRSGRGDTTFASYITERKGSSIEQSLLVAAATVSHKMETPGAYKGTRQEVMEYIKLFY